MGEKHLSIIGIKMRMQDYHTAQSHDSSPNLLVGDWSVSRLSGWGKLGNLDEVRNGLSCVSRWVKHVLRDKLDERKAVYHGGMLFGVESRFLWGGDVLCRWTVVVAAQLVQNFKIFKMDGPVRENKKGGQNGAILSANHVKLRIKLCFLRKFH